MAGQRGRPGATVARRLLCWSLLAAAAFAAVAAGAASTASGARAAGAPTTGCPPAIEGTLVVGKTVSAGNACWGNNPTSFSYQWLRCDSAGANCNGISGANKESYTLTQDDNGHAVVVLVTASNSSGTTGPVNSKPSQPVSVAAPPAFKGRPSVTGKTQVGEALVAKVGTFTGGIPRKYVFQWQTCDQNGASCTNISGATSVSYGVRSADVGHTLRVQITASNDYGSDTATSDHTAAVQSIPQPVVVTTTVTASRAVTTCCQAVRLSGTISTHNVGQVVTILGREYDDIAAGPVTKTTTTANGEWTAVVRPSVKTTYWAQAGTAPSAGVAVNVRPRVGLGIQGRRWTTKVTGRDSFAGTVVWLQRRVGYRWVTVHRVVLKLNSVAHFTMPRHRGRWTVRAFVPTSETGPGYLSGTSHLLRISA
jgi:hypothetical protein